MEVEAKFILPDAQALQYWQQVDQLAGFSLSARQVNQVHDTYLDTPERSILAAGYACRRREQGRGILVTLKGLRGAKGAIHRREELELLLPASHPPTQWPAGPVRERILELIDEAPLMPLFELSQTRTVRQVSHGERPVAELSLDEVRLVTQDAEQAYFELEVELAPQGTEDELVQIVTFLRDDSGLQPETRSKFERALATLGHSLPQTGLLAGQEHTICMRIAQRKDLYRRRAVALLALDQGSTQVEAGRKAGLSARQVRHWLADFRQHRLGIFPQRVLEAAQATGTPPPGDGAAEQPAVPRLSEPASADRLEARAQTQPLVSPLLPEQLPKQPGLDADDSMAEAARKTFNFHLQRMLYHEPGTRQGEDIEALHDMRVATRRMRAAFQVFGDYLDMEKWSPVLKGLRRTGRALGAVRDLDVFWEKTQHYLDSLSPGQTVDLSPLRAAWEAQRTIHRTRMLEHLNSERYARFKDQFGQLLQAPAAGALPVIAAGGEPLPHRLRHVVPVVVYQRLGAVRAYDEWVTGPNVPLARLHQLRIAAKGLRYTLEFFREVLGPDTKTLIEQIKMLQDHLGDLQDATVASTLLRDFLTWGTWGPDQSGRGKGSEQRDPVIAPGVAVYLAARQTELQCLVDTFPQIWSGFQGPEFSQSIAMAVAPL